MVWTKFPIAPASSAHHATRLRVFEQQQKEEKVSTAVLIWFDPRGKLQAATWRYEKPEDLTRWPCSVFLPEVVTSVEGNLDVCVFAWGGGNCDRSWSGSGWTIVCMILGSCIKT